MDIGQVFGYVALFVLAVLLLISFCALVMAARNDDREPHL